MTRPLHRRRAVITAAILALAMPAFTTPAAAQAVATPAAEGAILAAGSATAGPILEAAADAYAVQSPGTNVTVERTSSGDGIARFCAGETDIATSGRRIRDEEAAACAAAGVAFDEFEVAFDGVAVVVNPANAAVSCLTVDQLRQLWEPGSPVAAWRDLDEAWPAEPVSLYGTGSQSGTYQFFTQAIVGEEGASRDDYEVTDGHPATAERVAGDANGLGFLPLPRYVENRDQLKLVAVDGGSGCIAPSAETVRDGSYAPLSRPLFLYTSRASLQRLQVGEFLRFALADAAASAEQVGLVASTDEVYAANLERLEAVIAEIAASGSDHPATRDAPAD